MADIRSGLVEALERDGFCLARQFAPEKSTLEIGQGLGQVVNIERLLPFGRISTVQSLRPRSSGEVGRNQYSGHYGLGVFPLHTDLAHWAVPPRYLILRCIQGSNDVCTHLLSWTPIVKSVGEDALRKAVLRARVRKSGCSGLVRAMSGCDGAVIHRWDPIFLKAMNQHARALADVMLGRDWSEMAAKIWLVERGDTLVVDNWQMLHGRGEVVPRSISREIDRVYLSEVFR